MSDQPDIPTFVAIAYRYGWTNNHWYIVAAGTNQDSVTEEAEEECSSRGGKYGIAVVEITRETDIQVAYFPSAYDEKKPHFNQRISLFDKIGSAVAGAIERGELFSGENVEVPDWLRKIHDREKEIIAAIHGEQE